MHRNPANFLGTKIETSSPRANKVKPLGDSSLVLFSNDNSGKRLRALTDQDGIVTQVELLEDRGGTFVAVSSYNAATGNFYTQTSLQHTAAVTHAKNRHATLEPRDVLGMSIVLENAEKQPQNLIFSGLESAHPCMLLRLPGKNAVNAVNHVTSQTIDGRKQGEYSGSGQSYRMVIYHVDPKATKEQPAREVMVVQGKETGLLKTYAKDGTPLIEAMRKHGKYEGAYKEYAMTKEGVVEIVGQCDNDEKTGEWTKTYPNGITEKLSYLHNLEVHKERYDPEGKLLQEVGSRVISTTGTKFSTELHGRQLEAKENARPQIDYYWKGLLAGATMYRWLNNRTSIIDHLCHFRLGKASRLLFTNAGDVQQPSRDGVESKITYNRVRHESRSNIIRPDYK